MINDILTAFWLGVGVAFSIGPVFFILLETSVLKGFKAAISFDLGVIFADILFIYISYSFTSSILFTLRDDPCVFLLGGVVLVLYSIYSIISHLKKNKRQIYSSMKYVPKGKTNYIFLFLKGFFLNFINVVVLIFWIGVLFIATTSLELNHKGVFIFFSTILLTYFSIDIVKILIAKKLSSSLTPKNIFKFKFIISFVIFICGVVLIFQGLNPSTADKVINKIEHHQ